jgi:hypothetical protein
MNEVRVYHLAASTRIQVQQIMGMLDMHWVRPQSGKEASILQELSKIERKLADIVNESDTSIRRVTDDPPANSPDYT